MFWRNKPLRPAYDVLRRRMGPLETPLARRIARSKARALGWHKHVVRSKTYSYQRHTRVWAGRLVAVTALLTIISTLAGFSTSAMSGVALVLPAEVLLLLALVVRCRMAGMTAEVEFIEQTKIRQCGAPPILISIRGPFPRSSTLRISPDSTAEDILRELRRRHLISNLCGIGYNLTSGKVVLQPGEHLSTAGIGNLSTLDLRLSRLGGSASNPPSWDPQGTEFTSRRGRFPSKHPQFWVPAGNGRYLCTLCEGTNPVEPHNIPSHEGARRHVRNVENYAAPQPQMAPTPEAPSSTSRSQDAPDPPRGQVRGVLSGILHDMATRGDVEDVWVDPQAGTSTWSEAFINMDGQMDDPDARQEKLHAAKLEEYLNTPPSDIDSDEQLEEHSNPDDGSEHEEPPPPSRFTIGRGQHTIDLSDTQNEWFPWPDRETCVLDILRHVPRCSFSRTQNTAIHWAMQALGLEDLPSDRVMDNIDRTLQPLCGIQSIRYSGKLGNTYYVNDLAAMVAQELANPLVRDKLRFLPEDNGKKISQAWQARRWRHELDADLTTPMIRVGNQDFYLNEPCLLNDGTACMPTRWFTRGDEIYAETWNLVPASINGRLGWVVDAADKDEESRNQGAIPISRFLVAFPAFAHSHQFRQLPDPRIILGMRNSLAEIHPWTKTDPFIGNAWRKKAQNHRVVAVPLWLYCDDTSGNTSKKWNKHNSFLMTAAGLPRKYVHREFNIHFLATSNLAPPLEMLDGITEQLDKCQEHGIWAYDVVHRELVLVIPSVLALLGDNPMQSEFACHIGFRGKFFCRACWVKGDPVDENAPPRQAPDPASDSDASVGGATKVPRKKAAPKKHQTVAEMVSRVTNFMKPGIPRNRAETCDKLRSQFVTASVIGKQTAYKDLKTASGLKDTFMEAFVERLFAAGSKKGRTNVQKQSDMNRLKATFPDDVLSPVWRIKDLDPHQDTPVEILHVILLGFVKYFWRDAVARLKDPEKALLETRLSSIDVSGLGLSPLPGHTLVHYAGSLVGRDFRALAQVAPFVLQGMLSEERVAAWIALSRIVTLVWQPEIEDIDAYCSELEKSINHFLDCTCRLSLNWFNKPKFHIILHLPSHIRRFGPAMLFATEGFESFNAIIRSCSVHSNRHAPSRDIAARMARGNRLRHLLSGGFFRSNIQSPKKTDNTVPPSSSPWMQLTREDLAVSNWVSIHEKPKALLERNAFGSRLLGFMDADTPNVVGSCDKLGPLVRWYSTKSSHVAAAATISQLSGRVLDTLAVHTPAIVYISNGDKSAVGSSVVYRRPMGSHIEHRVGRIAEVLQIPGSAAHAAGCADLILVSESIVGEEHARYGMRQVQHTTEHIFVAPQDVLCTVNIQHNCLDNNCQSARTKRKFQEREEIQERGDEIRHMNGKAPVDWILNTAQMRDASTLTPFRPAITPLSRDKIIESAAQFEFTSRPSRKANDILPPDPVPIQPTRGQSAASQAPQPRPNRPQPIHALSSVAQGTATTQQSQQLPSIAGPSRLGSLQPDAWYPGQSAAHFNEFEHHYSPQSSQGYLPGFTSSPAWPYPTQNEGLGETDEEGQNYWQYSWDSSFTQ
ncbi:hypothetical protein MKEN_00408600 [Mycena kentingensis (nom. inval.)]|nr:hypothetical protein MKEN_00408600 [Mycena kentingensis (nom. inval.)]